MMDFLKFTLRSLERYSTRCSKPRGCLYNRWNNCRVPSLTFVAIIRVIFLSFPLWHCLTHSLLFYGLVLSICHSKLDLISFHFEISDRVRKFSVMFAVSIKISCRFSSSVVTIQHFKLNFSHSPCSSVDNTCTSSSYSSKFTMFLSQDTDVNDWV